MRITEDIHELIGHTPMIHLNHLGLPEGADIYAKAELFNPGGSIKDRLGEYIVSQAEKRGDLQPGGTIIEITAGNTGIGLTLAALNRGHRVILVVPANYAKEKQAIVRAYGAEVINTPAEGGMPQAKEKALELKKEIPGAYFVNQFENPDNPETYYHTLAPEIYDQMDGQIDYFVCGAGSGGTFSGTVKYLKKLIPGMKAVLSDPVGSVIGGGDEKRHFMIEGIGNYFVPKTMDRSLVDQVIKVSDEKAFAASHLLSHKEGLMAGSSSGAALSATMDLIEQGARGRFVIILPDRGERYLSEGLYK